MRFKLRLSFWRISLADWLRVLADYVDDTECRNRLIMVWYDLEYSGKSIYPTSHSLIDTPESAVRRTDA